MSLWSLFIIVAGRGGIGKTLLATLLTTALLRIGKPPIIVQADIQRRLDTLFPDLCTTIVIDRLEELATNPLALVKAFSAIPARMRECAAAGRHEIVDTAATWHTPIIRYCAEINLVEKAAALGGQLVYFVPTTADTDSLILAAETAKSIESLVPAAKIVLVLNAYPTMPTFDVPALVKQFGRTEIHRILKRNTQITLPAISPQIWGAFERANLSPLDVTAAEPKDLMSIAGVDVDTVEVMQGRVARWLNQFISEAAPLLQTRND